MNKSTWRKMLADRMEENGDSFANIVSNTMTDAEMDVEFYRGYGSPEGIPFTVWTKDRVYFPICYDGAEWVGSAARNPDGNPTEHQGGG